MLSEAFWTPNIASLQFDEYSQLGSRSKSSSNEEATIFAEYSQLCSFGLDREKETAIKELFEARGWDYYVHEISLAFLNFSVETFLARNNFVQPFFAAYNTTVVSAEPETERKGDSCTSAISVTAGVDVSHSGQGNEASELDDDREECVFCFCCPCVTCVRQQWLGYGQDVYKRNSRITTKLYRKCRSMMNMRGAWRYPLYVRKKETATCRDHTDRTVVPALREIMPERVVTLVRGLYPNPPDTLYLGHSWW